MRILLSCLQRNRVQQLLIFQNVLLLNRAACYRTPSQADRVPGERWVRPLVRRIIRGKPRLGGMDKLKADDRVGVLGRGRYSLQGYDRPNPIVAGIALMTHPSEWPTSCEDYPVKRYLQHSAWANDEYRP